MKAITPEGESFVQASVAPDGKIIAQHNFEHKDYEFGGVAVINRSE